LGRRPLGAILHLSNEPGELWQWLCHDDRTINIVLELIIIIIKILHIIISTLMMASVQIIALVTLFLRISFYHDRYFLFAIYVFIYQ